MIGDGSGDSSIFALAGKKGTNQLIPVKRQLGCCSLFFGVLGGGRGPCKETGTEHVCMSSPKPAKKQAKNRVQKQLSRRTPLVPRCII